MGVKFDFVFVEVVEEVIGIKDFCDFDKLIRVVVVVEERFFFEDY